MPCSSIRPCPGRPFPAGVIGNTVGYAGRHAPHRTTRGPALLRAAPLGVAEGCGGRLIMAHYAVNDAAVAHIRQLIDARQYVLRSDWGESQPTADDQNAFLERHTWDDYAAWHLGLTEGAKDETKARYAFVAGDFRRVHRSGLIACLPSLGVAAQSGRVGRPRPPAAPRRDLGVTAS